MVETFDLPPSVIVICPKCGTKNARTDMQCRSCDTDLTDAKRSIAQDFRPQEKAQLQTPASFEQQVLAKLNHIETKANENQGFMIVVLVILFIVLLMAIF